MTKMSSELQSDVRSGGAIWWWWWCADL